MKHIYYIFAFIMVTVLFSCSDGAELNKNEVPLLSEAQTSITPSTRATMAGADSISPLEINDSVRYLLNLRTKAGKRLRRISQQRANYDANFNSNMFAIRELPVRIEVLESGKDKSRRYLYCSGTKAEVKLTDKKNEADKAQRFYIKILPASAGIPYLLYSESSQTPLTVGHYNKTPNINIMMSSSKDEFSNLFVSWDLKPTNTDGYFSIENEMLLGQKDPNNMWSVFNYYLNVNDNDEVRFAEYTGKNQQKFLVKPLDVFTVNKVDFDFENAKVTDAAPYKIKLDRVYKGKPDSIFYEDVNIRVTERSWFQQYRSNIRFDLNTTTWFQMPTVLARKALLLDGNTRKIRYITSGYQDVYSNRTYTVKGRVPSRAGKYLISIYLELTSYKVEVPYTAYAKYNDREIKFTGTWEGFVIPDSDLIDAVKLTRFFDVVTGEEVFASAAAKSFKIVKK